MTSQNLIQLIRGFLLGVMESNEKIHRIKHAMFVRDPVDIEDVASARAFSEK